MFYDKWKPDQSGFKTLRQHPLFLNRLKPDVESGDVFPALRKHKIDFYHLGRKLFSFDGHRFRTNAKFAFVLAENPNDEVTEADLAAAKIVTSFEAGYEGIKQNITRYRTPESAGLFHLCKDYSYARQQDADCVVLDIERSFVALDSPEERDRVDLVLFRQSTKELLFVEAKCFDNQELWPTEGGPPAVVQQVARYDAQIAAATAELVKSYAEYVRIVNELFGLSLPGPSRSIPGCGCWSSVFQKVTLPKSMNWERGSCRTIKSV
jgi:hypothetical protein